MHWSCTARKCRTRAWGSCNVNAPPLSADAPARSARHAPGMDRANSLTMPSSAASASSQPASNLKGGALRRALGLPAFWAKIAGRYSCLRTTHSRATTSRLQNLRSCPIRVLGALSEYRRSFEVKSVSGSGAKTASICHAPQDVGSGTSPSKSACSSREGDGLMPLPGNVAQTRLCSLEGVPESCNEGKDSDTASASSLHRSWNGCSDFRGLRSSSELSAHSANRPPSWSGSQLPCRTVGKCDVGALALAAVGPDGRFAAGRVAIRCPSSYGTVEI